MEIPHLGIPLLNGYLRARKIPVTVLDANMAFCRLFPTPEMVRSGREFAEERIRILNEKPQLDFREVVELRTHLKGLQGYTANGSTIEGLLAGNRDIPPAQAVPALDAALSISTLPCFPETVTHFAYDSHHVHYRSQGIIEGVKRASPLLSSTYRNLLSPLIRADHNDVVGLSVCYPSQVVPAFHLARMIKELAPRTHVTMGGSFVSLFLQRTAVPDLFNFIDTLVVGDGEIPLEQLYRELTGPSPDLSRVPGLIYRSGTKVLRNSPAAPLPMDAHVTPDFDGMALNQSISKSWQLRLPFRLSRGCRWGKCAFCRTRTSMVRQCQAPDADTAFEMLRDMVRQTGKRRLYLVDDAIPLRLLTGLSRKIVQEHLSVNWIVNSRFDPRLDMSRALQFRQAGCHHLSMGLEIYNDRLLHLVRKGTTTAVIDQVLSSLSWTGLPIHAYMIVGLPTETLGEAAMSFRSVTSWLRAGKIMRYFYHRAVIPQESEMFSNPRRYGIRRMFADDRNDLKPAVVCFESDGMTGKQATRLANTFNRFGKRTQRSKAVTMDGKVYPTRYDPKILEDRIFEVRTSGEGLGLLLEAGMATAPPLRPGSD
ncbi:MAG: hypothetical protein JRL30_02260 [Deltaproteobacteria bacterium]|nr:hypothetical protein [Deltaproteobacteria bacterium]